MAYSLETLQEDLAAAEGKVANLRPGCEKSVVWAGASAQQTDWAVVYLHGFSASGAEIRPVPDLVAEGMAANLFFARLRGHGRGGAAMAEDTLADWRADVDEALAIGRILGRRLLVIGCSTGCTLAVDALARGKTFDACCFISPNFGLRNKVAQVLLDLPGSHLWATWIIGKERSFEVISLAHAQYWATRYPTQSVRPMADAIRFVQRADLSSVTVPMMMALNLDDRVIDPMKARQVLDQWGGPSVLHRLIQHETDDVNGHVMAGDVFSPGQSKPLAETILQWAKNL